MNIYSSVICSSEKRGLSRFPNTSFNFPEPPLLVWFLQRTWCAMSFFHFIDLSCVLLPSLSFNILDLPLVINYFSKWRLKHLKWLESLGWKYTSSLPGNFTAFLSTVLSFLIKIGQTLVTGNILAPKWLKYFQLVAHLSLFMLGRLPSVKGKPVPLQWMWDVLSGTLHLSQPSSCAWIVLSICW